MAAPLRSVAASSARTVSAVALRRLGASAPAVSPLLRATAHRAVGSVGAARTVGAAAEAADGSSAGAVRAFSTGIKKELSPHLTIYKFGINAITSVGFRATGILMSSGIALGSIGMLAASHPLAHYVDAMRDIPLALPFVKFAISAPLTYHFIGGLRHLGWDNIILQDYETALLTGKIMLGVTAVASVGLAFVEF